METKDKKWIVGQGSHIYFPQDTSKIMFQVILALLPAAAMAIYVFGFDALKVLLVGVISAVAAEALIQKYLMKTAVTISDYSAALTGLLLALNLPAASPWWMICIGSLIAIGIGKLAYGGLGQNPFNPALVGRVALLIGFPALMTDWSVTGGYLAELYRKVSPETLTAATPLGFVKAYSGSNFSGDLVNYFNSYKIDWQSLFIGTTSGSIGEVSELALLLGGLFLVYKKVINWEIPVSFVGTVGVVSMIAYYASPDKMLLPHYHLLSGGLFLGAIFMATDMVTSPFTFRGRIVFGIGCGVLTMLIRLFGGYPEGVSFAILLMNIFVPIIDIYIKPKKFGV